MPPTIVLIIVMLAANPVKRLRKATIYKERSIPFILPEVVLVLPAVGLLSRKSIRVSRGHKAHEREEENSRH